MQLKWVDLFFESALPTYKKPIKAKVLDQNSNMNSYNSTELSKEADILKTNLLNEKFFFFCNSHVNTLGDDLKHWLNDETDIKLNFTANNGWMFIEKILILISFNI